MQSTLNNKIHLAIIMDGNRRWAAARGLSHVEGHDAGARALRRIVEAASAHGIATLTVYAFASENWRRPKEETGAMMALFSRYLDSETEALVRDGVRLSVIGRRDRLGEALVGEIVRSEAATEWGDAMHLRLAVDYSALGRRQSNATFAVTLGKTWSPQWRTFVDMARDRVASVQVAGVSTSVDAGITFVATPTTQIDFAVTRGISDTAPPFQAGLGLSSSF